MLERLHLVLFKVFWMMCGADRGQVCEFVL